MVSVLALYSDNPSSHPAEAYFSVNLCLKRTKINKKRPGLAHFINIIIQVEKESGKRPVKRISVKERYHLSTCTCLTSKLILKIKNLRDLVVCR